MWENTCYIIIILYVCVCVFWIVCCLSFTSWWKLAVILKGFECCLFRFNLWKTLLRICYFRLGVESWKWIFKRLKENYRKCLQKRQSESPTGVESKKLLSGAFLTSRKFWKLLCLIEKLKAILLFLKCYTSINNLHQTRYSNLHLCYKLLHHCFPL